MGTRQELAAYLGYESYPQFAGDFYYYRDYTPAQMEAYLETIRQELVPLYREMYGTDLWSGSQLPSGEAAAFRYVRQAAQAMGAQEVKSGDAGYLFPLVGQYAMQILVWEGDEEFPPSAQVLYSDNFAEGFAAEDRVVAGDILISTIKANM